MRRETKALSKPEPKRTASPVSPAKQARVRKSLPPLTPRLEELVSRYAPKARRGLRKLFRENNRYADLAVVFPAAAYALASAHIPIATRREAANLVVQGAPLKHVAKSLGLPLWLRRLPPHAFYYDLNDLPAGESFSRKIANRIPACHDANAFWFESVRFCVKACNEEFALWVANQRVFAKHSEAEALFATLAAYAWHSREVKNRARGLIFVPWHPEIAFDTAVCAAKSWLNRLRLVMQLEKGVITDPWFKEGEAKGFQFTPLLDHESLLLEARAMKNCADQYASQLARDRCRLFSITRLGMHIATLEIGPHPRETGILTINQLKGRHNMPASLSIWQAAHAWVSSQDGIKRTPTKYRKDLPLHTKTWKELTADYRSCKNGATWLPEEPGPTAFQQLETNLADLARRGGVRSWLFTGV